MSNPTNKPVEASEPYLPKEDGQSVPTLNTIPSHDPDQFKVLVDHPSSISFDKQVIEIFNKQEARFIKTLQDQENRFIDLCGQLSASIEGTVKRLVRESKESAFLEK